MRGQVKVNRDHITLDKEMVECIKKFIGDVWLMRKAQHEGNETKKWKYQLAVDYQLGILVKEGKEVAHA